MKGYVMTVLGLLVAFQQTLAVAEASDAAHKVLIQVSTNDARTHRLALNNAENLQKSLGRENVDIEVVAYGPGLSLLTLESSQAPRVRGLLINGIRFTACGDSIKKSQHSSGRIPELINGVTVVPAGVTHIIKLQEQGYVYLRP